MALKSEGVCCYCNKTVSKQGMNRHVSTHLTTMAKELPKDNKDRGKYYHISVTAAEMFLTVVVEDDTPFDDLDNFIRGIWLECCGHMSSFRASGVTIMDMTDDFGFGFERGTKPMTTKVGKVFKKDMLLKYEYDFGSTTELKIKVMDKYTIPLQEDDILLISRNEPLPILCMTCEKEYAEEICSIHIYEDGFFCKKCAKKHAKECEDFADYAKMPVVNSPRMGVCAYEGGGDDPERDGIYKEPKPTKEVKEPKTKKAK
jgi:hypothetical protein